MTTPMWDLPSFLHSASALSPLSAQFIALIVAALLVVRNFVHSRSRLPSRPPLPPGPPGDPLIGHVRCLPLEYQWKTFAALGKTYGDLIYMHVFGRPMIILNSIYPALDLMARRGANYSDRPRLVLLCELMSWDQFLSFLPYNDRFRKHRRMMQQYFNSHAVNQFQPLQHTETSIFLRDLAKDPENFAQHIHRLTASMMKMVVYGHRVTSGDDSYVSLVERAVAMTVDAGSPGGALVDFLPWLRHIPTWMPGAGFKRYAFRVRDLVREFVDMPFSTVRSELAAGVARPSFASNLVESYERTNMIDLEHEEDMKGVSAGTYAAGTETTQAVLMTFILAMTLFPEAAKKAQQEIDHAVGRSRLPDFEDRDALPFIDCIMKEVLRWNPPVPLGIPHRAITSDVYQGRRIPAGSMVIANIWQMVRDERLYVRPDEFSPERFLWTAGKPEAFDPRLAIFGFGRRACPGRFFADMGVWLVMATALATFDFLPPADGPPPTASFTTGFTSHPKPFACRIVPRDAQAAALVAQSFTEL